MMTRTHVLAMFNQRGYHVALRVLRERKARGEYFVYLENLRRTQVRADARTVAREYSGEGEPSPISSGCERFAV